MSTVNRPKTRAGAEFFQQPTTAAHRQYEALRAYFVEGLAAAAVAEHFGYTTAAFYALCRDFRAQRLEFFRAPSKPGPKQAPMRINQQGQFRPQGWYHWVPFTTLVPTVGRYWQGQGTAFTGKDTQLDCTLLGHWDTGHQDAWLVLTDLSPHAAQACWYGVRAGNRTRV